MPQITRVPCEPASLGEAITLHDDAHDSSATILPGRGALISSFRVAGRELLYLDRDTLIDLDKNVRGGVPVLFPAPGKLAGDSFRCGGRAGSMKQHGFARTLAWNIIDTRDAADAALTLALHSTPQTRAQYPWEFALELEFTLHATTLALRTSVTNTGAEALPFALGFHPYFRVDDKAHARIATGATRVFDNVTKQECRFSGFDFSRPELDLQLLDHGSDRCALQLGDGSRIEIDADTQFSRWVVWALADKPFICVEPWTAAGNALNTGEGLCWLEPGLSTQLHVRMHWIAPS
jgi:galactose mutarotase-like enzyme